MADLRCQNKLHAQIVDGELEVKCGSKFCGAGKGVVVLHRFDLSTQRLVRTLRYTDAAGLQEKRT